MNEDSQHIKEILTGDAEAAIYALVKKYETKVFNLCFRIIKNREHAEEVTQDAFLKSFRALKKLEDHSKYEIWLNRIAYHLSIDVTRKKKRYYENINDIDHFTDSKAVGALSQLDRKMAIEQILKAIPAEDAALITLFYLNEMQVKEIGEVMKMSVSNVKVKLLRIRKILKEHLNNIFKEEVYELY